jgi:hypothetical protein
MNTRKKHAKLFGGIVGMVCFSLAIGFGSLLARRDGETKGSPAMEASDGLVLTPDRQHLGKIPRFEAKKFAFDVRNNSKSTMRVVNVERSCGCTKAVIQNEVLSPGQSTRLEGSLSSQDRSGEFESVIRLTALNDSGQQSWEVKVGANAVTLLEHPELLDLGEAFLDEAPKSRRFVLKRGMEDTAWNELKVADESLESSLQRQENGDWILEVRAPHGGIAGTFRRELKLECWRKGEGRPVAVYPVAAIWKAKSRHFQLHPSDAYLGVLEANEKKKVRLKVSGNGDAVSLEDVELSKGLQAGVELVESKGEYYLEIRTENISPENEAVLGVVKVCLSDSKSRERFLITLIGKIQKENTHET